MDTLKKLPTYEKEVEQITKTLKESKEAEKKFKELLKNWNKEEL